ncbi:MAG: hypothetical protein CMO81_08615 [Waddliaceae bacterium]|nr:hypothetical protein [Waddliaceae bacterium]
MDSTITESISPNDNYSKYLQSRQTEACKIRKTGMASTELLDKWNKEEQDFIDEMVKETCDKVFNELNKRFKSALEKAENLLSVRAMVAQREQNANLDEHIPITKCQVSHVLYINLSTCWNKLDRITKLKNIIPNLKDPYNSSISNEQKLASKVLESVIYGIASRTHKCILDRFQSRKNNDPLFHFTLMDPEAIGAFRHLRRDGLPKINALSKKEIKIKAPSKKEIKINEQDLKEVKVENKFQKFINKFPCSQKEKNSSNILSQTSPDKIPEGSETDYSYQSISYNIVRDEVFKIALSIWTDTQGLYL